MLLYIYYKYNQYYNILYFFIIISIITSILNHGLKSDFYKYLDRYIITISTLIFIYYILLINNIETKILYIIIIAIAIYCYKFSKLSNILLDKNILHALAHFLVTILVYSIHSITIY